ncbi:unnamed protein product [Tenebrio molitor]|nr:unnamed protein product [Tenebrio molitor]
MHVMFTPTSTKEKAKRHADNEYFAAQMIGEKKGKCDKIFRDCSTSLMDMLTVYNTKINF